MVSLSRFLTVILLPGLLTGCVPLGASALAVDAQNSAPLQQPTGIEPTRIAAPQYLWIDPAVPDAFLRGWNLPAEWAPTHDEGEADARLTVRVQTETDNLSCSPWTLALAAPFPTVIDSVGLKAVQDFWQTGKVGSGFPVETLLLDETTEKMIAAVWGEPDQAAPVRILSEEKQVDFAWGQANVFALIPFQRLEPRWKVIQIGGRSPLRRDLAADYPLTFSICLTVVDPQTRLTDIVLPAGNRDEEKMSLVALTGTTAPVRGTAFQMETEGITFPAEKIAGLLSRADITHISNEVPFYADCPPAVPLRREARFCGEPEYVALLQSVGVDVIELTGNHVMDWGPAALLETLALYQREKIPYYGGGADEAQAAIPWQVTDHGNRLVFLGCNSVGPETAWAKKDGPGALKCDFEELTAQIRKFKQEGYLPLVTLQDLEYELIPPASSQRANFRTAAQAGAVLVSGSQAHNPQGFRFYDQTLVHYGLGNLLFDQTFKLNRPAFIDLHVFYDNRYLGAELVTITMPETLQPRFMTETEREKFLTTVFTESEWK